MALGSARRRLANLFLLNPSYQSRFYFWTVLLGALIALSYSIVIYAVMLEWLLDEGRVTLTQEKVNQVLALLGVSSFFLVLFGAAIMGVLSHRTAGALYRFKQVFDGIKAGDPSLRIQLRKNDDFGDVAQSFNEMMDSLRK